MKSAFAAAAACAALLVIAAADVKPASGDRELVERYCGSTCHTAELAVAIGRTPEQWKTIIDEMIAMGATPGEAEAERIHAYLSEHHPPRVEINYAPAREIAVALEIPVRVAAAVVQHRDENGPFRNWQDVAKVPALKDEDIESKRDRLVF